MDFRKDVNLPEIRNVPVSPVLHGDRDDREPTEFKRTIITSAITQDDLDFYEELERKQNLAWKRRLEQDNEYTRELSRIKQDADFGTVDLEATKKKREPPRKPLFGADPEIKAVPTIVIKGKGSGKAEGSSRAKEVCERGKEKDGVARGATKKPVVLLEGYSSDEEKC